MTHPQPRLAAALHAAERGWPVFPVHPWSKYPAVPDWENRATRDHDQITRWWRHTPYNIGIPCQPAGLVVLDLDAGHGQSPPPQWARLGVRHGRDVLAVLADRAGQPDPVDTYTVSTPSDGEHRYFLAPPERELRNSCARLGWKIIRSRSWFLLVSGPCSCEACKARVEGGTGVPDSPCLVAISCGCVGRRLVWGELW